MENTIENKAKFFAQYFSQKVLYLIGSGAVGLVTPRRLGNNTFIGANNVCLQLKSLSSITDEDAIGVAKILYGSSYVAGGADYRNAIQINSTKTWLLKMGVNAVKATEMIEVIDFLRSKGYALPYMGLSVEKQIENGWIKLTP